ncbi:aldehyde dehydrogenase domain-containing protein [Flagelloscypha sp. PMI_526]|nr:aldehyde dehydrogenase domain-containing protein [Flagelloscypha sp. PMI_526]
MMDPCFSVPRPSGRFAGRLHSRMSCDAQCMSSTILSLLCTRQTLTTVVSSSTPLTNATIENAQKVFESGVWSRAPALQRSLVLSKLARLLEERLDEFVEMETLQTGRAIREMKAQLGRLPEWLDYYAALLRTQEAGFIAPTQGKLLNYVTRVPLGVVAQILPFNHPLLIGIKKIAPALATGNSVIVKPSEFAELAVKAGVPAGVLSVLPGYGHTAGKDIVSHPLIRHVDVTAGTQTGRSLGSIVGHNLASYTAELGGKVSITNAVNGVAFACFVASGQTCVSGTRIIVQEDIYDLFATKLVEKVEGIRKRMGNPLNPQSTMGTVISMKQLIRIESVLASRSRGTILTGGTRLTGTSSLDEFDFSQGAFFSPTIITDIAPGDELWDEEIFGPVIVLTKFKTPDEAVELANACKYGLGAGIWTNDVSKAHRISERVEAGLVWVNTHHRNDPSSPWGGMKQSGIGRENGEEAMRTYTQSKSTIVSTATVEEATVEGDWFAETGNKRYG